MKRGNLIVFLLILSLSAVMADNNIFNGRVIDVETGEPVSFVTINSNSIYTSTNSDGEYTISNIPEHEKITFSHISYEQVQIDFASLVHVIKLKLKPIELSEVIITPRETIINDLEKVWKKYYYIVNNRKEKDFPISTYYYRQLTACDSIYTEYIESFLSAPTSVAIRNMTLYEGRYARIRKDSIPSIYNYFMFSQVTPFMRKKVQFKSALNALLSADFEMYYDVYLLKVISANMKDEIKVYQFIPFDNIMDVSVRLMSGNLFVRSSDNAIVRAEIKMNDIGLEFDNKDIKKLNEEHDFIITYRDGIIDYPIVESVQCKTKMNVSLNDVKRYIYVQSTIFSTECVLNKKGDKLKSNNILIKQISGKYYDKDFWNNNPVIKRTNIEQKILDDFERLGYFGNYKF